MRYKWLNKKNNKEIIVFFNGWGMDEGAVKGLNPQEYDVLMFYDYNSLDTDFDFSSLESYRKKYLVAWSMGVMCASNFDINYDKKIAVNGTLKPVDDKYGIPEKIYDLTLSGLSVKGVKKFIQNMFVSEPVELDINRDFESQKSELRALKNYNSDDAFKYDKVLISALDRIIPTKNQEAFWGQKSNIDGGHYIFHFFENWGEIL